MPSRGDYGDYQNDYLAWVRGGRVGAAPDEGDYTDPDPVFGEPRGSRTTTGRGGAGSAPDTTTGEQRSAYAILKDTLRGWGLEELAGWAYNQLVNGDLSPEATLALVREQEPYRERFGVARDGLSKLGLPVMSEAQIMAYEKGVAELARRYNLPPAFGTRERAQQLIARGQSYDNVARDIEEGFARVARTAPETRAAFAQWFGTRTDAAIASLFIDGDLGSEALIKAAKAAELAGLATGRLGMLDRRRAEGLVDAGVTEAEARVGFERIDRNAPLFAETITEGDDLVASREGIDAEFGIGGGGGAVERRRQQRLAQVSGGGGARRTRDGIGGLA